MEERNAMTRRQINRRLRTTIVQEIHEYFQRLERTVATGLTSLLANVDEVMAENRRLSVEVMNLQHLVQQLEERNAHQEVRDVSSSTPTSQGTEFFNVELAVFGPEDLEVGSNVRVRYSTNAEELTATVLDLQEDKVIIRFHETGRRSW